MIQFFNSNYIFKLQFGIRNILRKNIEMHKNNFLLMVNI